MVALARAFAGASLMGPLPLIPSRAKRDRCVWQTQRPLLRFAEIGDQPFERPASRAVTVAPSGRCCCATDHRCCRIAPFCDGQHSCKIRFPQFKAAEMKLAFCESRLALNCKALAQSPAPVRRSCRTPLIRERRSRDLWQDAYIDFVD